MVTVGVVAGVVERRAGGGQVALSRVCWPADGVGRARERVVRGEGGIGGRLRPRRSRCSGCGVTHVLMPVSCLLRRADGVAVIWAGLAAGAAGAGHRKIAAAPGGRRRRCAAGWPGSARVPGWSAGCSRGGCARWTLIRRRCRRRVWVPKTLSPHAAWEYSRISPLSRSRRRTRMPVTSAAGWMRPAGGFCCSERCGRCVL
jgi:hypothetical protein